MSSQRVLGCDLSLTSSGIASSLGWSETITPRRLRGLDRLRHLAGAVADLVGDGYQLAVIEGPSYRHGAQRGHDELSALRWMVRDRLDRAGLPVAIASPSSVKLWATGRGGAPKTEVARAMDALYPGSGLLIGAHYDRADALALAAMGAAWIAETASAGPQQRALAGVAWPEVAPM